MSDAVSDAEHVANHVVAITDRMVRDLRNETPRASAALTEDELDWLVNRFLCWKLPATVCSDLCVTMPGYPHQRTGTNLLTATEARQMLREILRPSHES